MNNVIWITILGFYTLIIVGGIYYYEDKLQRAIASAKLNSDWTHYTYLQIENAKLKEELEDIRKTAGYWQRAYNLKQPLQYNYAAWHQENFNSIAVSEFQQDILDTDQ
jgi:hypothetical protein